MAQTREELDAANHKPKKKLTVKKEIRSRLYSIHGEAGTIGSQSGVSQMSSQELPSQNSLSQEPFEASPAVTLKRTISSRVPGLFAQSARPGEAAASDNDEKDYDADAKEEASPNKRRRLNSVSQPVSRLVTSKAAFMEALEEFYNLDKVKQFNQRQLAAALICWFGEVLEKPDILNFVKGKGSKKEKQAKHGFQRLIGLMAVETYAIAESLRSDKAKNRTANYLHNHVRLYAHFKTRYDLPERLQGVVQNLKQMLRQQPNPVFDQLALRFQLVEIDKIVLACAKQSLPPEGREKEFVMNFFKENLTSIEINFTKQSANFIISVMYELGNIIATHKSADTELAEIFKRKAARLIAQSSMQTPTQTAAISSSSSSSVSQRRL
jgi:hypothetical protein